MWHLCGTCCLSKSRTYLIGRVLLACLMLVMGVDAERHIYRCMPRKVLNLFDVQPAFKQPCDVGVPQQVGRDVEIKTSHHLGIGGFGAEFRRIINRSSPYHVPQIGEAALRQRLAVFHVQDERASAGTFKPLQRVQKRWGYGRISLTAAEVFRASLTTV